MRVRLEKDGLVQPGKDFVRHPGGCFKIRSQ